MSSIPVGQQVPHRDYHLGFVPADHLAAYPAHLHRTSPVLTLRARWPTATCPSSGPTMMLPYSQRFPGGYIAFNRPEFVEFFAAHHVQIPLRKGDAVFFNPALYHGAGSTRHPISAGSPTCCRSSPFGRAMEALDRSAMVRAVYPELRSMKAAGRPAAELANIVVATAEGMPSRPTSTATSRSAACPPSQVDTVLAALADLSPQALDVALRDQDDRRMP